MEDEKVLENNENIGNNENSVATENTEELNKELEELAELFRKELAKTTEEFETGGEVESEATEGSESVNDEEIADEPEGEPLLCALCGESYENGKEGICEDCLKDLRNRPFGFVNVLLVIAIGVLGIVAMRGFWDNVGGYALAYEAKAQFNMGNISSAKTAYDNAISYFEGKEINARNLYFESAEAIFIQMSEGSVSMTDVADRVSKGFDDSALPMPQYTKYKNMGNEALVLYGTMQSFYDIVNKSEYQQYTADDRAMYNSIMKELDALIGAPLEIQTVDGKLKEVTHNEAMVYFCQYMFAYTSGKTYEAQEYLAKVYETEPDYLWLYAYEYALSSIGAGDIETAEKLAGSLIEADRQDVDGYSLYSTIARLSGDADKAIEWTDKALEFDPENAELLRLKAMALVVKGDPEQAKEVIDEALTYESYGILYYTSIVIENELGNTETVEETVSMLQSYGLEVSDRVNSYLAGKITTEQLFTEGTGDVE
ncbi:MAG: tetratricopeptide repeat protein [Clostridia bacterium]|nr:tetratricopeptide repeat protein [Clostridia bacterium]